jgi:hypothetical protein
MKNLEKLVNKTQIIDTQNALLLLLTQHLKPAFGASKALDHELAAIAAMQIIGYLPNYPTEYELITQLRVTKAKARSLIYQLELRAITGQDEIEARVKLALRSPRLVKDGEKYLLEIDSPLVLDALRHRLRHLNHVADSSFQPALVKLSAKALVALIEHYIPSGERHAVEAILRKAGIQGSDLRSLLVAMLQVAGKKIAGEVGGQVVENLGSRATSLIGDVFDKSAAALNEWLQPRQVATTS